MGEHSEWDKYTSFEIAHKAPMMLHLPGVIEQVSLIIIMTTSELPTTHTEQALYSDSLVEFVDIFPTLVEAAGLPNLEKCPDNSRNVSVCREGRSLLGLLQGKSSLNLSCVCSSPYRPAKLGVERCSVLAAAERLLG